MSLFLITGLPGTGKSTVRAELAARGVEAYDADEDHLAHWYDTAGNAVVRENEERTAAFINAHTRDIARQTVADLAAKATGSKPVFLCGDPENEGELQDLFAGIFALILDEPTRQHRLDVRQNNSWAKLPHEREYDRAYIPIAARRYARSDYILVNAAQPAEDIADFILETVANKRF